VNNSVWIGLIDVGVMRAGTVVVEGGILGVMPVVLRQFLRIRDLQLRWKRMLIMSLRK
jgi:hypothetical protein